MCSTIRILHVLVLVMLLAPSGFPRGDSNERHIRAVGRKSDVDPGEFPFVVRVLLGSSSRDSNDVSACTGSLIASDWVLTAAHCLVDHHGNVVAPEVVQVLTGHDWNMMKNSLKQGDEGARRFARNVVVHPRYSSVKKAHYDLGMIQVRKPFSVAPVRILTEEEEPIYTAPGTIAVAVGWGRTRDGEIPDILQKASAPVTISLGHQQRIGRFYAFLGMREGDSGGPLLVGLKHGWGQIGVASLGSIDTEMVGSLTTYIQTSLLYDWIFGNVSRSGIYLARERGRASGSWIWSTVPKPGRLEPRPGKARR